MADKPTPLSRSAVPGLVWPPIASPGTAVLQALVGELQANQWLPRAELERRQNLQLASLLEHAYDTTEFYRERLDAAGYRPGDDGQSPSWSRIAPLTRKELHDQGRSMLSRAMPAEHGETATLRTSGSTGFAVDVTTTRVAGQLWQAQTIFEHLLQRRRLSAKQVFIKFLEEAGQARGPVGVHGNDWGPPTNLLFDTGPSVMVNVETPVAQLAELLVREDPVYIISYPSNLAALARHFARTGAKLPSLMQLRSIGEALGPEVREICRDVFGVGIADVYSCQELGLMAVQCPEHEHHHVTMESADVEVLQPDGTPCRPGETGRVVVTSLANFAQPLVRYEIGDYATTGEPCDCGRAQPVLSEITGRVRNMLTLPNGDQLWPRIRIQFFADVTGAAIEQVQLVQRSLEQIRVRLAPVVKLSAEQEASIGSLLTEALGHAFQFDFEYLDEIPRGAGGKFEDFRSELELG